MKQSELKAFLDEKYAAYHRPEFIENDPILIPHLFTKKQDIEIAGFFAATFAWGQRKTIINKCRELMEIMDMAPHDFILGHQPEDLKPFANFKHRTFNSIDFNHFAGVLKEFYSQSASLESAFFPSKSTVEQSLIQFHNRFFEHVDAPQRTRKHIATPAKKSTCKRLNMFLRWMVRKDPLGVDFGLWNQIEPASLMCPFDVHVEKVGRKLGLISRKQRDWQSVVELTVNLRKFDPLDPVKYDYALFGLGVEESFG